MKRFLFHGVGALVSAIWLVLLLKIVGTMLRLSAYRQLETRDVPSIVIPLVGFVLAAWIGFRSRKRISPQAVVVIELVLGVLGLLFLIVVEASGAG